MAKGVASPTFVYRLVIGIFPSIDLERTLIILNQLSPSAIVSTGDYKKTHNNDCVVKSQAKKFLHNY